MDRLDLPLQVGEDIYYVSDNMMGVTDGVGWSHTHVIGTYLSLAHSSFNLQPLSVSPNGAPSLSASFVQHLMHFCSDELAAQASSPAISFHDSLLSPNTPLFPHPRRR